MIADRIAKMFLPHIKVDKLATLGLQNTSRTQENKWIYICNEQVPRNLSTSVRLLEKRD